MAYILQSPVNNHTSIVSVLISEFGCDPNDGVSLRTACRFRNLSMVKTLIECGANVNGRDADGNTLIHITARIDQREEAMQTLLNYWTCDPNIKNKEERTPLHVACMYGNLSGVKLLIKHGARVNLKDIHSNTPLSLAVLHNHSSIVSALISEFGCDPNDGVSLRTACRHGNLSMVKTLIVCGANVNGRDADGNTLLHMTARIDQREEAMHYWTCDPNIKNKEERTPLHVACMCGNLSGVKLLIKHGARVNLKDIHSNTPLSLAVLHNHTSIASALVSEFGCDPNDGVSLNTACEQGNLSIAKTLLEHGASVNGDNVDVDGNTLLDLAAKNETMQALFKNIDRIKNKEGRTPLHIACMCGNLGMVKLLILQGAEMNAKDNYFNTPLSLAIVNNHTSIVSALVSEFGCDPNDGISIHKACEHGNLSMIKTLIECGTKDVDDNTLLHLTTKYGRNETVQALLKDFESDPGVKNKEGMTPLHIACMCGNLGGVKLLMLQGAEMNAKDIHFNTPLSLAIVNNHISIVSALVSEFGCDPNDGLHTACEHGDLSLGMIKTLIECGVGKDVDDNTLFVQALLKHFESDPGIKNKEGMTPLHIACKHGNLSALELLKIHGAGASDKDVDGNTPLHLTAKYGEIETMQILLKDFKSDPNIKNKEGRTPIHIACKRGNLGGVKLLIKHGASVNDFDTHSNTPLSLAVQHVSHPKSIILTLVTELGCDPNDGVSLHTACKYNDISSVKTLVKCGASVNDRDVEGNTPLYYGGFNTTLTLLSKFKCDPNVTNKQGMSPLHCGWKDGDLKKSDLLIEYGAAQGNTSVQHKNDGVASLFLNHDELICVYEREAGRSLLHEASRFGNRSTMELLIREYGMSPFLVDEEGNTPLHLCSKRGHSECVWSLLYNFQSPVYVRNRAGKTPRDVSSHSVADVFHEYIVKHQGTIEKDYKIMQKLAATRYSGSHCITRVFIVGYPGAGKSSLVEALKREGFIQSFNRVSSKSVALHTAGIVPSVYTSDSYGRVQFYDFAGDSEYYSSHAAILEKLFLSNIGNNVCIIVLNLEGEDVELENTYIYWLTFINHNTMNLQHPPSVIVTGSHADLLSRQGLQKKEDCIKSLLSKYGADHVYLSLDCCGPRTTNIKLLRQKIQELSKMYEPYNLSYEGSALLGLLEKDFSSVTACTAKTIASHITEVNLLRLPTSLSGLYQILKQLQAIGSLLILGGKEEDCYLVLNVSQLTNEVHKRLFSEEAFFNKPDIASFNIGLLPQSLLQEVLPEYITKECLTQLQYCQEMSHVEIGQDYSISPSYEGASSSPDNSLLFFPALCKLDRSNVSWLIPPEGSYSIGWLARCTNSHDYFPPRFLHVLLLRVSLRFTLVAPTNLHPSPDTPPDHVPLKRRCKMWKTGVHWLTEEGVECELDVDISKQVVVRIRSEEHSKKALTVFNSIINCVMEAKAEFCYSIQLKCFLLDKVGCLSEDNLFQIEEVERVLTEHNDKVISARGDTWMSSSKFLHIRCTFWDSLFPLDEQSVLQYIEDLVDEWFQLGEHLELPYPTLRAIESDFPNSVRRRKLEIVTTWLSSSHSHPPCWWSLVKALQEMGENASAAAIIKDKGMDIV